MENFNVYVGRLLKELRESKNVSQGYVADKLNRNRALISYWEIGRRQMNISDLVQYMNAINATDNEKQEIMRAMMNATKGDYSFEFKKFK